MSLLPGVKRHTSHIGQVPPVDQEGQVDQGQVGEAISQ